MIYDEQGCSYFPGGGGREPRRLKKNNLLMGVVRVGLASWRLTGDALSQAGGYFSPNACCLSVYLSGHFTVMTQQGTAPDGFTSARIWVEACWHRSCPSSDTAVALDVW